MSGPASKTSNIADAYRMFLNVENKKLKNREKMENKQEGQGQKTGEEEKKSSE
jgi:hypothetical protein